jgi:glycosyltransferase involved in cell wall biosynthesis
MKIVIEHSGILPIKKYGGIERMIFWHMKELARLGHKPILIGHPESQVEKYGIELIKKDRDDWWKLIPKDTDGIQLFYNFSPPNIDIPVINTIGGSGQIGEQFHRNTVFVSKKHAELHGSNSFVYNALDLDDYPMTKEHSSSWDNFLFLAKASWSVKNLKSASSACRKNKKHLHICGGKSWFPSRYLHNHGMVGGQEKVDIINQCDAIIFPIRWHEPFGLAVIEAMALGIPAITSQYGSMLELINNDVGIICNNQNELNAALLNRKNTFNPKVIRKYVEDNFCINKFTLAYIELFKNLAKENRYLNEKPPEWINSEKPEHLLPF